MTTTKKMLTQCLWFETGVAHSEQFVVMFSPFSRNIYEVHRLKPARIESTTQVKQNTFVTLLGFYATPSV